MGETTIPSQNVLKNIPLDTSTLFVTENDKLSVKQVSKTVIGDWEQDVGDWTTVKSVGNNDVERRSANGGAEGSTYWFELFQIDADASDLMAIRRTVDLSDIEMLVFFVKGDASEQGYQTETVRMIVGGDTVWSDQNRDDTDWKRIEVDVSSYSGDTEISFEHDVTAAGDDYSLVGVDRIKLIDEGFSADASVSVDSGAGN